MKLVINSIFFSAIALSFASCKMDSKYYEKSGVVINLTHWDLPDTAKVSIPFNLALRSYTDNSCFSSFQFVLSRYDENSYRVYGQATYENRGETCTVLEVNRDSTLIITPNKAGRFYFFFLYNDVYRKDSIQIIPNE